MRGTFNILRPSISVTGVSALRLSSVIVLLNIPASSYAESLKIGDKVEASPSFRASAWESCVFNGMAGPDYVVTCGPRRTEYVVQKRWVRIASAPQPLPAEAGNSASSAAPAKPSPSSGACKVGARVTNRGNRSGVVVEANGADCSVLFDDSKDGRPTYSLAWMLKAEGEGKPAHAAADGQNLANGRYECWAANGVAGTMRLEITGGSSYASGGKSGKYSYDPKTKKIKFESGAWGGFYGGKLGPGKIGISSRPGGSYGTTCDLK